MRLAAAEVGLQLYNGVAAGASNPLHAANQQTLQAFSQECSTEKLGGLSVFVRALTQVYLPQVRGELGLLVTAAGDIGVRRDHFSPWLERAYCAGLDQ